MVQLIWFKGRRSPKAKWYFEFTNLQKRKLCLLSQISDGLSYRKRVEENVVTFKHFCFSSESPVSLTENHLSHFKTCLKKALWATERRK